jgi:hypothetical protein
MTVHLRPTKPRGGLDRATLTLLGKGLRECFDEVRQQEVPERFKLLLLGAWLDNR